MGKIIDLRANPPVSAPFRCDANPSPDSLTKALKQRGLVRLAYVDYPWHLCDPTLHLPELEMLIRCYTISLHRGLLTLVRLDTGEIGLVLRTLLVGQEAYLGQIATKDPRLEKFQLRVIYDPEWCNHLFSLDLDTLNRKSTFIPP